MGEQNGSGAVPLAFFIAEAAAERGLDAEKREEILRYLDAGEALGLALAGELIVADAEEREVGGEIGEGSILRAEIEEVSNLRGLIGKAAAFMVTDPRDAIGIEEGKRAKEQRVHDAEDGGCGADAEAGDQGGEEGEPGVAAQGSKGIAEVLKKAVTKAGDGINHELSFDDGLRRRLGIIC